MPILEAVRCCLHEEGGRVAGEAQMKWAAWLRLIFRRNPARQPSLTTCPTCGQEMTLVERTTMTGNDMRSYRCDQCKREHIVNFGPALWQILHDAREREKDA